jgi:hypothetical protein
LLSAAQWTAGNHPVPELLKAGCMSSAAITYALVARIWRVAPNVVLSALPVSDDLPAFHQSALVSCFSTAAAAPGILVTLNAQQIIVG